MKILYMGTAEFSAQILARMLKESWDVIGVVSQPDRPKGRGQKLIPVPVKEVARKHGIPIMQAASVKDKELTERIRLLAPDVIATAAFGQILPADLLAVPSKACINVHASLLPKYRGAAPINRAIMAGETETGITTIFMVPKMDAGDILIQRAISITNEDDAMTLSDKLAALGGEVLVETLARLNDNSLQPRPQDPALVTFAPMLEKTEGLVDWNKPARYIWNQVRALVPWPRTYSNIKGIRVTIHKALPADVSHDEKPGLISRIDKDFIRVACKEGYLNITELQREGKNRMRTSDFLKGFPLEVGDSFGE